MSEHDDFTYPETVTVFAGDQDDDDWPPTNGLGALQWFRDKLDQVPEAYRSVATIEIKGVGDYEGTGCAEIVISYDIPLTQDKIEARRAEARQGIEQAEAALRQRAERESAIRDRVRLTRRAVLDWLAAERLSGRLRTDDEAPGWGEYIAAEADYRRLDADKET